MRQLLRRLIKDRRGVSAVEFALVSPVLIMTYFGLAELSQGLMAQSRVSHAASAIGDLAAQDDNITNAEMANIFAAATAILSPTSAAPLNMRLSSVTGDVNGNPKVDWSDVSGTSIAAYTKGQAVTLPTGLITTQGDTLIMAETTYTYTSPISFILKNGLNFSEKFYLRPRKSALITRSAT